MGAPCSGVPPPGGKPVPSGKMLMSQTMISPGSIGFPKFGAWAKAALEASTRRAAKISDLGVDMFHLPSALDRPSRDAVVVLAREACYGRNLRCLPTRGHDLGTSRLHIASLVPRAALQYRGTALPAPRHAKATEGLAVHRFLKRRLRPALATISRHHDLRNSSVAGIGNT